MKIGLRLNKNPFSWAYVEEEIIPCAGTTCYECYNKKFCILDGKKKTVDSIKVALSNCGISGKKEKYQSRYITIRPNPFHDIIQVNFDREIETPVDIEIISILGNFVYRGRIFENTNIINSRFYMPGLYIVQMKTEGKLLHIEKIIKY